MNTILNRFCMLPLLLAMSACAELNQFVADLQTPTAQNTGATAAASRTAETVADSLTKICQAVQQNQPRTQALYENKILRASGVVSNIRDGYFPATLRHSDNYSVTVDVAQSTRPQNRITVFARSSDETGVTRLSKGQRVQATGIVTRIQYMPLNGCWVTLFDATFSP